jgi:hypothetical protein
MFSFLSAFVSYDNLTNLLAVMAVYYLLAFFKTRSSDLLAISFLCQLTGCLTKSTFLPLVLVLNILLVIHEFNRLRVLPGALLAWFKASGWRGVGLLLGISLGLTLNVHLYGGNYIRYDNLTPNMSDVLSPDKVMRNSISARNMIMTLFREGRISKEEALVMASRINHPEDQAGTIYIIESYSDLKTSGAELMGPIAYGVIWVQEMSASIFGILGHLSMPNSGPTVWPFAVLSALTGLSILVRWRPSDDAWLPSCLMVIAAFYGLFLLCYVSYPTYLYSGALSLALQGRYLFPVLGPIYAVSSYYLPCVFRNERARLGVSATASILFIASDFPFFLLHVTKDWFIPLFR